MGGERAYRLFRDALAAADLVGIAAYAARGKQYIVELLPYETGLAMLQLRYADELKPWSEVPAAPRGKPTAAELALARRVIDHLRRGAFDPTHYRDEVKDRVRELIAGKAKGGEITAPPGAEHPPVTDLMAALKASLGSHPPAPNGNDGNGSRAAGPRSGPSTGRRSTRTTVRRSAHTARRSAASHARGAQPRRRSQRTGAHR
jgi:DNA end-binding protein Ku